MNRSSASKRVALLVTGKAEWLGMAQALGRLFPAHHFYVVPTQQEVTSFGLQFPYEGFTSNPLKAKDVEHPPESARLLVQRAAQEALGDGKAEPPILPADLVVVLDDLELCNQQQPQQVTQVFRAAVLTHLGSLQGSRARTERALSDKVSFHLIVPMLEAWFFADPGALRRAGVPPGRTVAFNEEQDPEQFATADPAYLAATESSCPTWQSLPASRQKKLRPKWLGEQPRERHPKGYLQWLCIEGADRSCTTYDETASGSAALRDLRLDSVLARDPRHLRFLASLVDDIADALGESLTGLADHLCAEETARAATKGASLVLRNL